MILDIFRNPLRRDILPEHLGSAVSLLEASENNELDVVISPLVREEFELNAEKVRVEAVQSVERIIEHALKLDRFTAIKGPSMMTGVSHWRELVDYCFYLSQRLLQIVKLAPELDLVKIKAADRLREMRLPSSSRQDSFKDCMIFETYLAHARESGKAGLSELMVFASSNSNDYAKSSRELPQEIVDELEEIGLAFAPNMSAAKSLLFT